ncbi:MAG: hypothetical protein ACXVB0_14105 [Mucilaginibacter sp.]
MDIKDQVKFVVEATTCAVHHEKPLLTLFDGDIQLQCCCDDFKLSCYYLMLEVLLDNKHKAPHFSPVHLN